MFPHTLEANCNKQARQWGERERHKRGVSALQSPAVAFSYNAEFGRTVCVNNWQSHQDVHCCHTLQSVIITTIPHIVADTYNSRRPSRASLAMMLLRRSLGGQKFTAHA